MEDIPERIVAQLNPMQRIHMLHEDVIEKMAMQDNAVPKGRGVVLPLTDEQRLARMRYLGGETDGQSLDRWLSSTPLNCPDLYYMLRNHNGGKSPTAPDPADHWTDGGQTNRTVDCIGGMAWCGGWDRYQPVRFSHIYDGWINTDSMIQDARGPRKCFLPVDAQLGAYVVCQSGSPGHKIGHIGGIVELPENFDVKKREDWIATKIVDCSYQGINRCNNVRNMGGWFGTGALFVVPNMVP
jgi:hypothetical protein